MDVFAIVLDDVADAAGPHEYPEAQHLGQRAAVLERSGAVHRNHRAGPDEDRRLCKRAVHPQELPAGIAPAGGEIHPFALREPHLRMCKAHPIHRGCDRGDQQLPAEDVLVPLGGVGRPVVRPIVVCGIEHRPALFAALDVPGVQPRQQRVAEAQPPLHDRAIGLRIGPGRLVHKFAVAGVQPHDRRKHAELQPADLQFPVPHAQHVAADIVAPPAIADVRRRGGEIRLEGQAVPGDEGIAREAHRIAVAAGAGVAGEGQPRVAPSGGIQVARVVQHEQRVDARHAAAALLLPVDPPEVHALFLEVVQHRPFKGGQIPGAARVEGDRLAAVGIDAHLPGHRRVQLLEGPKAVGGMVVQRDLQAPVVQPLQEPRRVREHRFIPGIARPAGAVLRFDVGDVPVHVQHRH